MKRICRILFVFACLMAGTGHLAAQQLQPLDRDRLAKDIANVSFLAKIPEIRPDSLTSIRTALGPPYSVSEDGFGLTLLHFRSDQPGGYTRIGLKVFVVGDRILRYRAEISGRSDSWWMIRTPLIDAWTRNTKFEIKESGPSIYYEREFPEVIAAHNTYQVAEFGEFKDLPVPVELDDAYRLLSSSSKEVVVGRSCGYGGWPPEGNTAINGLVEAGRWDLVENLLSGPNLGGRVYAALELLRRERSGIALSELTTVRIGKLRNSEAVIASCSGCFSMHLPIRDIFTQMEKSDRVREEWQKSVKAQATH